MRISKETQIEDLRKVEKYLKSVGKANVKEAIAATAYRVGAERGIRTALAELGIGEIAADFAEESDQKG